MLISSDCGTILWDDQVPGLHAVEDSLGRIATASRRRNIDIWPEPEPVSASDRVSFGIMQALEQQRMVPGQRLIETDLVCQFGVGRNAVREAIQHLAARGIVHLSRNRSPAIRMLSLEEAMEVLEVAEALTGLLARGAARKFDHIVHRRKLNAVLGELANCEMTRDRDSFNRTRRHFYRALLDICGNRELDHLFAAIHMQIVYAQFQSPSLQAIRFADYRTICEAVIAGDVKTAEAAGARHVRRVRKVVLELAASVG
jgi:DNA-binding GntR family transcriptional regulator